MNFPVAVMSAKPWMPLVTSREPVKEFDPVLVEVKVPSVVMLPEMEAAPHTSNFVSMLAPALMPTLPLVLKTVSPMVVVASVMVKVKPAEAMVVLASKVRESEMAVKFNVSAVRSALSILVMVLPVPLASKEKPVMAPSVPMSQSDVLTEPTSPLSPKTKMPFRVVEPLTLKSPPAVIEPVAWTPLVTSNPPAKELEAVPSTKTWPSISRSPEIKTSLVVVMAALPAVEVPNLEYAADANPPTCKVLPVSRYEAEAVPWTSARPEETNKARPVEENVVEPEKVLAPVPV